MLRAGLLSLLTVPAGSAAAQVVLDFNSTLHGANGFANVASAPTYTEDGFTITLNNSANLGNWGSANSNFLNDPVMASGASGSWLSVTNDLGNLFSAQSIDVVDFASSHAAGNASNSNQVTFYGTKGDNSTVSSTFTFGTSAFDKEAHAFSANFTDLVSLSWNQNDGSGVPVAGAPTNRVHMFDNLAMTDLGITPPPPPINTTPIIVAFGDSTTAPRNVSGTQNGRPSSGLTTQGNNNTSGATHNSVNTINGQGSKLYVYSDIMRDELPSYGINPQWVDNEGVGSNRTDHGLARLNADVLARNPDIVVIQYGINDSAHDSGPGTASRVALDFNEQTGGDGILGNGNDHPNAGRGNYTDNLLSLVQDMQNSGIEVIVMTSNKITDYNAVTNARLDLYAQVARDVAASEGAELLDVSQLYVDFGLLNGGYTSLLLDGVHPNGAGQRMVAEDLMELISGLEILPPPVPGDTNSDGVVNLDDWTVFKANFAMDTAALTPNEQTTSGDFNHDDLIDLADLVVFRNVYDAANGAGASASLGAVPEPGSLAILSVGVIGLLRRRRAA